MRLIYYRDHEPAAVLEVPDDGKGPIQVLEGQIPEEDLALIPLGHDLEGFVNGYANVTAAYAGEPYFGLEEEDAEV